MELKAKIENYTETERLNFIVQTNYKMGYIIKEKDNSLEAWGFTQEELEEQQKQAKVLEIQEKLNELDTLSIPYILDNDRQAMKIIKEIKDSLKQDLN